MSHFLQDASTIHPSHPVCVLCVCADCKWDVIVLSVCLGLQHTLRGGWFDL